MKIIKRQYDSVADFQADTVTDTKGRTISNFDSDFAGASLRDITGPLRAGWADGVERARALCGGVELAPARAGRMVRRWADDSNDGLDWDLERAMYELPPVLVRRPDLSDGRARGVRSFIVNIGESFSVGSNCMLYKALALAAVVDLFESQRARCEVWGVFGADCGGELQAAAYRIKAAADPINLGALCSAVAPWALRFWFFAWQDKHGVYVPPGRGKALKMEQIQRLFDFPGSVGGVIDRGDCLGLESARAWVKAAAASVGV